MALANEDYGKCEEPVDEDAVSVGYAPFGSI